jgi:predicted enzyme related to lactoylglutathione lyase
MRNALDWFEIPVAQLDRAASFYETILQTQLKRGRYGPFDAAVFPAEEAGGALVQDARRKPQADGTLVYLCATGQLDAVISRVAGPGGAVLMPKTDIGEPGFIALIRDTEGNQVGLHAERVRTSAS